MNAPRTVYRPPLPGDALAMLGVHHAAVRNVDRRHYSDDVIAAWSPPPEASRRDWLADLIGRDSTLCTVAVSADEAIVGFCIALPEQGFLKALYVHPDFTGQGIGQGLLQLKEAQCRDLGLVALEVNASFNAAAFYRRNGYEALGPVSQHLTDTVVMGAIRMAKRLGSKTP